MGRDKPKKFNKMNHQQKQLYLEQGLKKFGSEAVYHDNGSGHGMIDLERTQDKFEGLSRNDFDYRTSAQHMDGIEGNASASDFVNYQRGAQKLHKKAGNGGEYSSNEDITTVTNNLVNDYRSNLTDTLTANEQQSQAEKGISEPSTPTPEMAEARERVENFDNKDYGVYGSSESGDNEDQRTNAANSFLDKYKLDVKKGANFKPTI